MRNVQFIQGGIYHIYNRGVEKRDIFINDNDRWRFLQGLFLFNDEKTSESLIWELERENGPVNFKILKQYFLKNNKSRDSLVRIMTDCLMPNHYHLLIEEIRPGGISRFMHKLGTGYTKYFNEKYNRVGGLFQGTFKAVPVEQENHLQYLLVYINVINPGQLVEQDLKDKGIKNKEKIINFAATYPWSANREYLFTRESIIIDKGLLGDIFPDKKTYVKFIKNILSEKNRLNEINNLFLE